MTEKMTDRELMIALGWARSDENRRAEAEALEAEADARGLLSRS